MTNQQIACIYYEQWTNCYTVINNDYAYLFFDLGLYRMLPITGKDDTIQVLMNYKSQDNNGLPNTKEIDTLNSIGRALIEALSNNFTITYIGYLASNGVCGFYFCASTSNEAVQYIKQVMMSFSDYEYSVHLIETDCWKTYTDCFFPAYQMSELMQNGMVVARLEKGGDSLVKPRPVYHGFRFRKQSDRENFVSAVREEGFVVDSDSNDLENNESPFRLELSRTDEVDCKSVNKYTSYLWNLSYRHYGIYEGWVTQGFNDLSENDEFHRMV